MLFISFVFLSKINQILCKTNFDMKEIAAEEADYKNYPPPVFYHFDSPEERECTLYANFLKINQEVKSMIAEIQEFAKK